MANNKILTAEQEIALRQPIDDYVGGIQKKIDALTAPQRSSHMKT